MKLAYQQCETGHCRKEAELMVRDKRDYFVAVCTKCAEQLKKFNRKQQRK